MSRLAEGEEESSISPPHYALSERASLSLFLPLLPDGYDANKLLEEEGRDLAKREVEESKEMSKAAGKVKIRIRNAICVISP